MVSGQDFFVETNPFLVWQIPKKFLLKSLSLLVKSPLLLLKSLLSTSLFLAKSSFCVVKSPLVPVH